MFISFEGIDGSGKGTQVDLFTTGLESAGIQFKKVREPHGSIRDILLGAAHVSKQYEFLLFMASMAKTWKTEIAPALASGAIVVSDRWFDSTLAYQCSLNEIGFEAGIAAFDAIMPFAWPDATILLDITPYQAMTRVAMRGAVNRFDKMQSSDFMKVANGYTECCRRWPDRMIKIDASVDALSVAHAVNVALTDKIWKFRK